MSLLHHLRKNPQIRHKAFRARAKKKKKKYYGLLIVSCENHLLWECDGIDAAVCLYQMLLFTLGMCRIDRAKQGRKEVRCLLLNV